MAGIFRSTKVDEFLAILVENVGPRKKDGEAVAPNEWESIFKLVQEKDMPCGWRMAVSEWARVSRPVVNDRWGKKDSLIRHVGRPPVIDRKLEAAIAQRAFDQSLFRNAPPLSLARGAIAHAAVKVHGRRFKPSRGLLRGFLKRNPSVSARVGEKTHAERATGMTRAGFERFMDNCEKAGIATRPPHKVVNVDEAHLLMNKKGVKVLAARSKFLKRVSSRAASTDKHASMVAAVRADGTPYGKPIFIVKGASTKAEWVQDTVEYLVIHSTSGGMEDHVWEACCVYWASIAEGGEIFVIDGHNSHEDFLANEAMVEKGIDVITFPPHCTDVLQPLDVAFFRIFRKRYQELIDEAVYRSEIRYDACMRFGLQAWKEMFPSDRPCRGVIMAFMNAGICPFDRHAIADHVFKPAEESGRAFQAAKEVAGIIDLTDEAVAAIVDEVLPKAPAIPIDLAKAKEVARKSRKKVSELLTGAEVRARQAAKILAEEEEEAAKEQKRIAKAASKAEKDAAAAAKASARAEAAAAGAAAGGAGKKKRKRGEAAASESHPDAGAAAPHAGAKRAADAPVPERADPPPLSQRGRPKKPRLRQDSEF